MVDFFAQQDQARRNTGLLVLLFLLAVTALILITNLAVMICLWGIVGTVDGDVATLFYQGIGPLLEQFNWERFGLISLLVCGLVGSACLYKQLQLSEGGKAIAESLHGQRIHPNTDDPKQKMALNVVEEMALASGMPVPPVYLLSHELGINAFAAGNQPSDAVIGLTQGAIESLDRDQLQGVIAHEFSHILNGDMRLNIRLISLLHGIVFIGAIGEILLRYGPRGRSNSNNKTGPQLMMLGLVLLLVGWLGNFFGRLIKASVNRQREYLADASAVQFTRNPQGIAEALKVIGGHSGRAELHSSQVDQVSHLFFGRSLSNLTGLYATHPPLLDRIFRLEPNWDGSYIYPKPSQVEARKQRQQAREQERAQKRRQALAAGVVLAGGPTLDLEQPSALEQTRQEIAALPEALKQQVHEPLGAMAIIYGLLIHQQPEQREQQLQLLQQLSIPGLPQQCQQLLEPIAQLHRSHYLSLTELCMPALKTLSPAQYQQFKQTLLKVIRVDQHTSLLEWCLYQLVQHYLAAEFGPVKRREPRFSKPQQLANEYQLILSTLAHQGEQDEEHTERAFNRGAGAAGLYNLTLLPVEQCDPTEFIRAVNQLSLAKPLLKPRLLRGLELCVKQDQQITPVELELISAIFALMESPLSRLQLDSAGS
ncbi:peptidase M48 [Motiliproteus coralliicola]|uniref:Peptidase M48 n=1 Tax=Motiliproteus coralliicola TaxID=2283196 RepID=A0A369WFS1_9GAMM|nr:M48 family metallopeptidase [Motiliproteus coralliicola]RDE19446.1 peptidase M48 [Motiliproteus coralliicola]